MNAKPGTAIWYILPRAVRPLLLFAILVYAGPDLSAQGVHIRAGNESLNRVLMELARDYGVQLSFDDRLLAGYTVSLDRSFDGPEEAIAHLLGPYPLDYRKIGEVFTIYSTRVEVPVISQRVWGQVVDSESGESLPYSHIIINGSGTVTDFNGNFSFVSTDSLFRVRVSYLGYYVKDTTISPGAAHVLGLTPSIIGLQEVVVEGSMLERSGQIGEEAGLIRLNHKIAYRLPGNGDNAVFNFLRLQPGILAAGERSSELIIWGSYSGHSKILFDGFTIFGLKNFNDNISFVNPYMAKDIKVLKGGYGAAYENRVGGIVDISGINGSTSRPSINVNINNMTLNGMASVPIAKRSSLTLAYRQTYYQLYNQDNLNFVSSDRKNSGRFDINLYPDYLFRDMNLKFAGSTSGGDQYFISLYNGRDQFAYEVDQERNNVNIFQEVEEQNRQRGGSAFYGKTWRNGINSQFSMNLSGLLKEHYEKREVTRTSGMGGNLPRDREILFNNGILELGFRNSTRIPLSEKHMLETGWNYAFESVSLRQDSIDQVLVNSDEEAHRIGLFLQDEIHPVRRLGITPGIRLDYPLHLGRVYVQPRIRLEVDLADKWRMNAAAGVYHQFISEISSIDELGNVSYVWAISDNIDTPVLSSRHFVGGLTFRNRGLTVGAEGFYKTTGGITRHVNLSDGTIRGTYQGDARMCGLDLLVKQYFRRHEAWASYTLSRTEEYFPYMPEDEGYRDAPHDQRHEVKGALLLNFKPFFFSTNYVYGSGFIEPGSLLEDNAERYPYSRLDMSFIYRHSIKSYHFEVGISVLNVLNHENIKTSNVILIPDSQTTSISIHAEAIPFTPAIYLNMAF